MGSRGLERGWLTDIGVREARGALYWAVDEASVPVADVGVGGVVVGGDYLKPEDSSANFAQTADGGKTWTA